MPTLLEGQRYWVNLTVTPGTGAASWRGTGTNAPDMRFAQSLGDDPTWLEPSNPFILPRMMIETPEPSQGVLAAVGALVLWLSGRVRRRA
jgi:hypothetical protein